MSEHAPLGSFPSILAGWDKLASVRGKPRRMVDPSESDKVPFSPKLVPITSHPIVKERGPEVIFEILARRLFSYLRFTDYLETEAVVPAALLIAHRKTSLRLPDQMAFDGRRIATDEMYHAQCAEDLLGQMSRLTGVAVEYERPPSFIGDLQRIRNAAPKAIDPLAVLFFSIVSETLITSILKDLPQDEQVFTGVRQVVEDHNVDEARHHTYFARVLELTWEQLSTKQRDYIGPLIPRFIKMFLEPDRVALATSLSRVGLDKREIDIVLGETYSRGQLQKDVLKAAGPTLRRFKLVGALDHAATSEAMEEAFGPFYGLGLGTGRSSSHCG